MRGNELSLCRGGVILSENEPSVTDAWHRGIPNSITAGDVATHAYAIAGTYTVTLMVTDDDGTAMATILVSVGG